MAQVFTVAQFVAGIVGTFVGTLLLVGLAFALVYYVRRRRDRRKAMENNMQVTIENAHVENPITLNSVSDGYTIENPHAGRRQRTDNRSRSSSLPNGSHGANRNIATIS
ncbi:uncharacterized protein LOC144859258 [Branchiostoma floridae x Branchiostoma japonicum]